MQQTLQRKLYRLFEPSLDSVYERHRLTHVNLGTDHQKSDGGGGGGGEKNKKKFMQGKMPSLPADVRWGSAKKKNSCKEEGKGKKFMQKDGPIVTFSESLSFRNQQQYQAQY